MARCPSCSAEAFDGVRCTACGVDFTAPPEEADEARALIGRRVGGKFVLRALIGSGATGHVFRADQTTLGRTVAVKVLREHVAQDPEVVRRFHREALAASRLNHPNAVAVIDYGQEDGRLYIVMEFLRGRTLTEVLRAEQPVPLQRAVNLVGQVLDALEEAHAAGVVHADLKSDNIVVETLRGGGDLVKVVDFGISRIIDAPADVDGTAEEAVCGTPEYMAPEVIRGEDLTKAADQYGAAIVLYEVLTGATPFTAATTMEVLRRQLTEEPPSIVSRARAGQVIPEALEAAVRKALAKKPSERFGSVAELKAALDLALRPKSQISQITELRQCPACGAKNPPRFKFCPECGERVEIALTAPPPEELTRAVRTETMRWAPAPPPVWPLPLFGRDRELDRLVAFLRGEGPASTLLISAPVGLGKTRLVREAVARVAEAGTLVTIAGADPTGLASAWYPVRAAVAAILELPAICPVEALAERLGATGLPARDAPGLAELFGMESTLAQLEATVRRRECTAAALRVLRAAGKNGQRAVLVFEDVERYDALSLDFLARLAESPGDLLVRIVLTSAPERARRWPESAERLVLAPLDEGALAALTKHVREHNTGAGEVEAAVALGGGEPARIEHALRCYFEGADPARLPTGLADLIGERLAQLPADVRLVLQAAAVAGLDVPWAELVAVLGPSLDEAQLTSALDLLGAHGLLASDGGGITFEHPLVRDVVYDTIPADVRRSLHQAWAQTLPAHATPAAVLGHHADHGQLHDAAVARLIEAGDEAVRRFDDAGAVRHYQRAMAAARRSLHLGDQSGDPSSRLRDTLTAAIKLADALRVTGDAGLARGVLDEAGMLCDGSQRALEAQLRRAQAHLAGGAGDAPRAVALLREAIGLAMTAGSLELVASLYLDVATVHSQRGHADESERELQEGIDFVTMGEGIKAKSGPRSLWRLAARLSELQHAAGRGRDAVTSATCALRHAMRVHSTAGRARANSLLAKLYEAQHDLEASARHRAAAVEELRLLGDRRSTAELIFESANTGQFRIALDSLEEARTLAAEISWGERDGKPEVLELTVESAS